MSDSKDDPCMALSEATFNEDEIRLDLWYPSVEGNQEYLILGLMAVRATHDLRISYDFERDGWKIEKPTVFSWDADDQTCDPKYVEVCFIETELPDEDEL